MHKDARAIDDEEDAALASVATGDESGPEDGCGGDIGGEDASAAAAADAHYPLRSTTRNPHALDDAAV